MKSFVILLMLIFWTMPRMPQQSSFPAEIEYKVRPYYRYRTDGTPGREIVLKFSGMTLPANSKIEIVAGRIRESIETREIAQDSLAVLLPNGIGVRGDARVDITIRNTGKKVSSSITVPALRHWTVFVYPHSHVDIGYSNTHENVEFIHRRNIDEGIRLAEQTKEYPEGSRYLWNPEVMWPVERYLSKATPEKKAALLDAVKKGFLCLDASYVHVNTSICSEEELFQLFRSRSELEKLTGKPNDVLIQVDLPGMSWGVVPVMAHEGVKYIMTFPNTARGNSEMTYRMNQKPFWWVAQDGISKVLFLQPGGYAVGLAKGGLTGRPWFGQQDTAKIPKVVKTDNPRENFLDKHLFTVLPGLEKEKHPYDIYVVTWAMWDNSLQDADLPEAVRSWNEDYAFPKLIISGGHQIMETYEKMYGSVLPVVKGDYTEYWTDNMGVAARENVKNRNAKERLLQAETVWTLLRPGKPAPRNDFDEAWRYVILGSEHTYASENPSDPFFFEATWNAKQRYFREAEERSIKMLQNALAPATDISRGGLGPVEGPSNGGVAVINTHSWAHGGVVKLSKLESQKGDRVIDDSGNEVLSQRLSTGELAFLASDVPAMGSRHYRVVPGECSLKSNCISIGKTLDNGIIRVELDNAGNVINLIELSTGKNFADRTKSGGINTFWYQPAKGAGEATSDRNAVMSVIESGPLLVELEIKSETDGCRSVTRRIRLVHGQPWVEFSNTVDKLPVIEKDGVHFGFGFNIPRSTTRIDIPWNVMLLEDDQWPAANRAWMPHQHWVDISNENTGITWCSPDAALIESGSITANNTAPWEGKGDIWPSKLQQSSLIYSWVMNNHWYTNTPPTQDGPVTFRYMIKPHGEYKAEEANRFGLEQMQPLVHVLCDKNPLEKPLVSIDNSRLFVNILKSSEDGSSMIVRVRSLSSANEMLDLKWPYKKPVKVFQCDKGEEAGSTEVSGGFTVPANGSVTLKVLW